MLIPDLKYTATFERYTQMDGSHPHGIPYWWTGGTLVASLLGLPYPSGADVDLLVRGSEYPEMQAALRAGGWRGTSATLGVRHPSAIGEGPSSTWKRGATVLDVIALAGAAGDSLAHDPVAAWIEATDLNVCGVAVGLDPTLSRIVLYATPAALTGLVTRRVAIVRRHETSLERLDRYQRRLALLTR